MIAVFGQETSWLEIAGMTSGIAGVWLTLKENIWCFPVGIVNVAIYAVLFFSPDIRLYADALLQCIYILLLFYGWNKWLRNKNAKVYSANALKEPESSSGFVPVHLKKRILIRLLFILIISSASLAFFLYRYTDASYPVTDSLLTCSSLIAQWMIAKKIIENWLLWILADAVYIPMYISKQLPLTALLYFIFLIMAVKGYREWKKHNRHAT